MAKKRKPTTSRLTTKTTEAPMILERPPVAMPVELPVAMPVEPPVAMPVELSVEPPVEPPTVEMAPIATAMLAAPPMVQVERMQIARLAFARFVARGGVHGYHVQDWLAAEAELRGQSN